MCGPTYTAISISTGCLYIYGALSSKRPLRHRPRLSFRPPTLGQENSPYTFPDNNNLGCESLTAGACFVAFLDQAYTPIVTDDCLEPIPLHVRPGDQVIRVSAIGEVLYGLSGSVLYEWREPQSLVLRPWDQPACLLRDWTSHVFSLKADLGQVQLPVNTGGCADLGVLLTEQLVEYPVELLGSAEAVVQEQPSKQAKRTARFAEALQRRLKLEQVEKLGTSLVYRLQGHLKHAFRVIQQRVRMESAVERLGRLASHVQWGFTLTQLWTLKRAERCLQGNVALAQILAKRAWRCLAAQAGARREKRSQRLQRLWRRKQGRETQLHLVRCWLQWHLTAHSLHTRLHTAALTLFRRLRTVFRQHTAQFFPRLQAFLPPNSRHSLDTQRHPLTSTQRYRPPWRAPQPTGAFKASQVPFQSHERRLQYAQRLKQRHQEICRQGRKRPTVTVLLQSVVIEKLRRVWGRLVGGRSERLEVRWKVEMMGLSLRRAGLQWQKRIAWSSLVK